MGLQRKKGGVRFPFLPDRLWRDSVLLQDRDGDLDLDRIRIYRFLR
jgi:hypothetical protein